MSADAETATLRARQLTQLTERLTERLTHEMRAFEAHRAQDVAHGLVETQELANIYRREAAQMKANPSSLAAATQQDRLTLIEATQEFEAILEAHSGAVEAARKVSEGLVRTIAAEVAGARAMGAGYGASGHAMAGDGRAVALNRTA